MRFGVRPFQVKYASAYGVIAALCALALMFLAASAQQDAYEAGVIIDYGDDRITWVWIPFEEPETPLIDLLNETELEMVTVGFGGLGEGLCQVDDTGCPVADCRQSMCQTSSSSPFWRVMKMSDDEWIFTSSGLSGSKIEDGDIYALSWSSEDPELPVVSIDEVADNARADRGAPEPVAAIHTDGVSEDDSSTASWLPAIGALGIVVTAAGVLVYRARSKQGATG